MDRVCPGIYLADRAGFQMASAMAALYDVVPLEGRSRPKPETVEYTDTVLRFVFWLVVLTPTNFLFFWLECPKLSSVDLWLGMLRLRNF